MRFRFLARSPIRTEKTVKETVKGRNHVLLDHANRFGVADRESIRSPIAPIAVIVAAIKAALIFILFDIDMTSLKGGLLRHLTKPMRLVGMNGRVLNRSSVSLNMP